MWTYAIKRTFAFFPVYVVVVSLITYASWEQMDVVEAWLSKNATPAQFLEMKRNYQLADTPFCNKVFSRKSSDYQVHRPAKGKTKARPRPKPRPTTQSAAVSRRTPPPQYTGKSPKKLDNSVAESMKADQKKSKEGRWDDGLYESCNVFVRNLPKIGGALAFRYGKSLAEGRPVGAILRERVWVSIALTLPALIFSTILAVIIGLLSAFFRGQLLDRFLILISTVGMSVSFLVYIIVLQYLLAFQAQWFHIYGFGDTLFASAQYLILPILIQVLVSLGYNARFYRAVMVEESTRDYITTAYAKGVSSTRVIFVHLLKNAMIPVITRFFVSLPFVFMGSFLLEVFFGVPGLGSKLLNSLTGKTDPPLIIGATAILCTVYLVTNVVADLLYAVFDPRVRLEGGR